MGKADNIKRAKKLKEAKRLREKDAALQAGLNPADIALQKRTVLNGGEIIPNQTGIKYSELLQTFAVPILDGTEDLAMLKEKLSFCVLAWNAAIWREESEKKYQAMKKDVLKNPQVGKDIGLLLEEMVKIKKKKFSQYRKVIVDFEVKKKGSGAFHLSVGTELFEHY